MVESEILTGSLRINCKRYTDAFISNPDNGPDIYIDGLKARKGALEGDTVRVKLNDLHLWKIRHEIIVNKWEEWSRDISPILDRLADDDEGSSQPNGSPSFKIPANLPKKILKLKPQDVIELPFSQRFLQKTGFVIEIIQRNHNGVAGGFLRPHSQEHALFSPTDHRIPRMLISIHECPLDFVSQPKRYSELIFVARIYEWDSKQQYALGNLIKLSGNKNTIEPHLEALLLEHQVYDHEFPDDVIQELEHLENLDQNWLRNQSEQRLDLTNDCIFTIDPKTARDLDDALSVRHLGNQIYEVGVHIADVSHFVKEMTNVDYHARLRTTSIYLVDRVIPMLPRILCEKMCSLNPGEHKLTFSVIWKLDRDGNIIEEKFHKSIIKSCVKLAYEQAQDIIDTPGDLSWIQDEVNMPKLYNFNWEKVAESVLMLNKLAKTMRKRRFDHGALKIEQVKLKYELDRESGLPTGFSFETRGEANYLIEEFMLLANMAVAKRIYKHNNQTAFLRRHPPSSIQLLKEVKEFCDAKGFPMDITNSHTLQKSLNSINDPTTSKVVSHLLLKAMKNAEYICTGSLSEDDSLGYSHFALNVPFYTHFTSPIRRYADVIVHRQLSLALGIDAISREDTNTLSLMAAECTKRKLSSKVISDTSQKLYFNLFVLKAGFCEMLACVTRIYDKSFDVILVDYDRVGRVYLDKAQDHLDSFKFESYAGIKRLELVWKSNESKEGSNGIKKKKLSRRLKKLNKSTTDQMINRSILESSANSTLMVNEPVDNRQIIEVFDVISVIVTTNDKDITQLNIDLKIPNE